MNGTSKALRLAVVAGTAAACGTALGIGGPTAKYVFNLPGHPDPYPFVGRVQTIFTAKNNHIGTGSFLGGGVVLTCAHVIDPRDGYTPMGDLMGVEFERFQLGDRQYAGLGVQNPRYERTLSHGESLSLNDVGLILLLNGPLSDPVRHAAVALDSGVLHAGSRLTAIGFSDFDHPPNPARPDIPGSRKREGRMRLVSTAGGLLITRSDGILAGGDYVEPGDSGGPWLRNDDPEHPGQWIIYGITRSGGTVTKGGTTYHISQAVKADDHIDFIHGDGVAGQRVTTELGGLANFNWNDARAWGRGYGHARVAPGKDDIAVLDPTNAPNADTTVTITGDTADLDGLLNDVTLDIRRGRLRVAGAVGKANGRRTGTGALNGGRILVGGSGDAASLDVGWNMENDGVLNVRRDGTARFGRSIPGGYSDAVFFNAGAFTVDGGRADVDLGMLNTGATEVTNGTLNTGRFLPAFVHPDKPNAIGPQINSAYAVKNWGQFRIHPGGVFTASNGEAKTTATFLNLAWGNFTALGTADTPAAATIDRMVNEGAVDVRANAGVNVTAGFSNRRTVTVRGSEAGAALLHGLFTNDGLNARVTVGNRGRLEATLPGGPHYGTTYGGFINRLGVVSVEGGGVLDAAGRFENRTDSSILIASSPTDGPGIVRAHSVIAGTPEALLDWGSIAFDTPEGAENARMEVRDLAWTLSPGATLTGRGTIKMSGRSPLNIACDTRTNNWNDLSVIYDGGVGANNAFIPLEAACHDVGGGTFAGLSLPFALEDLCLTNNSRVVLGDSWASQDVYPGNEVLYVEKLGVAAGSILDLGGRTLYFKDWGCGGEFPMSRCINGTPIRLVPTPGALAAIALGLFAAGRGRGRASRPARIDPGA